MRRVLMNPTGQRDTGGNLQLAFRDSESAADSSPHRETEVKNHLLGLRFLSGFPNWLIGEQGLMPLECSPNAVWVLLTRIRELR
jgi:hypothetical protein